MPIAAAKITSKTAAVDSKASRAMSSPDKVVDAISKRILARRFGVGHRLVEADLANSLNVSRVTVREALKKGRGSEPGYTRNPERGLATDSGAPFSQA